MPCAIANSENTHIPIIPTLLPYPQSLNAGTTGGDWPLTPQILGNYKYGAASCCATPGEAACWNKIAPIHVADGEPTDQVRETMVQEKMQSMIDSLIPHIDYHPLLLPKSMGMDIDSYTSEILTATHNALNTTNSHLAEDCWLCMALGTYWPLAVPVFNDTSMPIDGSLQDNNCMLSIPFKVQPTGFNYSLCFYKHTGKA